MYIEKRGDKYVFREAFTDITGKVRRVSVTLDRNTAQSRKLASILLSEKVLEKQGTAAGKEISFEEAAHMYLKQQKEEVKATTWRRNKCSLDQLLPRFGKVKLNHLTAGILRDGLIDLRENATTRNELIKRLKPMIRWAYQNDLINSTACIDKLKLFKDISKREKVKDKYFEPQELEAILKELSEYYQNAVEFLVLSGLRIGEMVALDDDEVQDRIHVRTTYDFVDCIRTTPKTFDSIRDVYIQPELAAVIKRIRKMSNIHRMISGNTKQRAFFVSPYGTRFSYQKFRQVFREVSLKATGKQLSPHSLRHTHASLLAAQGIPLETISRRLGHSGSKVTREIYLHVTEETEKRDAAEIEKFQLFTTFLPLSV